jgi:hypothetical protein
MKKKKDNQYGFQPSAKLLTLCLDLSTSLLVFFFIGLFLYAVHLLPMSKPTLLTKKTNTPIKEPIEGGIHLPSGLIAEEGYQLVLNNCGACHSYKLVSQNSANAEGWTETIRWMQKTQKLWDLGEDESKIVAYLAKNYGVKEVNRRKPLAQIDWYEL